jgi:hypothetical protein
MRKVRYEMYRGSVIVLLPKLIGWKWAFRTKRDSIPFSDSGWHLLKLGALLDAQGSIDKFFDVEYGNKPFLE